MYGVICDFANSIYDLKIKYKSAVRKAMRAAEQGKFSEIYTNLTKARRLYFVLNREKMPDYKSAKIVSKRRER